ncbi:MAG: EscU/YscU/HrcU family type III secretion system export apparatus switch protein [Acidobacteriota bacterium]
MAFFGSDDKTEKPTGRRLQDARKKGQLPRSQRAPRAAAMVGALAFFGVAGEWYLGRLTTVLTSGLSTVGDAPLRTIVEGELVDLVVRLGQALALTVGPLAVTCALAVTAVQVAQGGWNMSAEAITLDFTKLNPANGLKRLVGQGPIDLLMMAIPVGLVAYLAWQVVAPAIGGAGHLARLAPAAAAREGWAIAWTLATRVATALVVLAAVDYGITRWRFMKGMRMTKQEVKDEAKTTDGNPLIKGRIRSLQRELFRKRMLADVARATVVITNPTHFAVALEYQRSSMAAPRVLAKGRDKLALRIKELAREHGVPVVENKPLAQALYWGADVGEFIPAPLFEAVAEVLAYLIRLKRLAL